MSSMHSAIPRRFSLIVITISLLCVAIAGGQQDAAPTKPSTESAKADPGLSVPEHIRKAIELLDELEHPSEGTDTKAAIDEINQHVIAVQTAEPSNPWLFYLIGRAHAARGRNGDAIGQLGHFVETREGRNEWKAFRILGDLFVGEMPSLAKPKYEAAAALKANEPTVLMGLSQCAKKLGDLDGAIKLAKAAVEADGRKTPAYLANLARMHAAKKQWSDAESVAREAFRLAQAEAKARPRDRSALQSYDSQAQVLVELLAPRSNDLTWTPEDAVRLAEYMRQRAETSGRVQLYDRYHMLEKTLKSTSDPPSKLLDEYNKAAAELDSAAGP